MSGKQEAPKTSGQEGLLDSVKQTGASIVQTVQQKAGGSQVRSVTHCLVQFSLLVLCALTHDQHAFR